MQKARLLHREDGKRVAATTRRKREQPPRDPKRALAYLRVSGPAQQKDGKNLEQQLDEVHAYCKQRGYTLREPDDVYRDTISGAMFDREGYYRLLARVERADAGVIVAYDVGRFGRNGYDNAWLLVKAKEFGFRLETTTGGEDFTRDPESEFKFDILSAVVKYERNSIAYRMMRGKKAGHARGHWVNGVTPLGYSAVGPRGAKTLVINEDARLVRTIFEQYAKGESMNAIAVKLLSSDARPAHGVHKGKWSSQGISLILDSACYVGIVQFRDESAQGQHEPIVPRDLWETVQRRRADQRARYPGRTPT